jgi:hypothetical protein
VGKQQLHTSSNKKNINRILKRKKEMRNFTITLLEIDLINKYFGILMIGGLKTRSLFYLEIRNNQIVWLEIAFIRFIRLTWQ